MDQLKLLMDYTKFHIGVYLTLTSVGLALIKTLTIPLTDLLPSIVLLLLAGASGGIIASSIPEYSDWDSFSNSKLKLLGIDTFSYWVWSKVEHSSFWFAVIYGSYRVLISI
jgi:hypothetical protein